jgi:hypothetical protein
VLSTRALLGVDLWNLYAGEGRYLPAAWVARAVGVSPTTMTKYLAVHCVGYTPKKGWSPGRGWNWYRSTEFHKLRSMNDVMGQFFISNGEKYEYGEELTEEEAAEVEALIEKSGLEAAGLAFEDAMELVKDGLAVSRMKDCSRVIFQKKGDLTTYFGTSDDKGTCTSSGEYKPSEEDKTTRDWMIDAHSV